MIETRLLQYFLAVAEEQSITRAAEYLHITQPTLSKQMMDLEAGLGKQLLIRGGKRVTLTEDGMYLRARAQEILALMESTEASFRDSEQIIAGDVAVGCGEYRSTYFIMELIREIQIEHPQIRFQFFSGNAEAIIQRLDKGLLDVGFLLDPEISPRYDYQKLPARESWGIWMRKDHPLARQQTVHIRDLDGQPLILPSQSSNHSRIQALFDEAGVTPNTVATYNLIFNAGLMAEAGMGCALSIDRLINSAGDYPLTFRPLQPEFTSHVYLFSKKYQVFSKATKLFLARLQQRLQAMAEE